MCVCVVEWSSARETVCKRVRESVLESARSKLKGNQDDLIQLRFHLETESSSDRSRKKKKWRLKFSDYNLRKFVGLASPGKCSYRLSFARPTSFSAISYFF